MTKYVRWLDLSHNDIMSLPDEFCALGYALDELHVRHNRLQALPQTIAQLQVARNFQQLPYAKKSQSPSRATRAHRTALISVSSPQPDISRSCKFTDTGLMCRVECLFCSQFAPVRIYTAW